MVRKPQDASGSLIPSPEPTSRLPAIRIELQDVVGDWMNHLKPTTRRVYERAIRDFAAFVGVKTAQEAAALLCSLPQGKANAVALKYRNEISERLGPSSVNVKLSALLALNDICRVAGFVSWRLELRLLPTEGYRDTAGPGAGVVEPLLERLSKAVDERSIRDYAVISVVYQQGLRRGEVVSLDLEHVDLAAGKLWLMGKGRVQREQVTLTPLTVVALKSWIELRGEAPGPLFLAIDRAHRGHRLTGLSIWRVVKGYGLGWPHALRHTAVSEVLVRTDGNLLAAQQFARHRDPKITMRYWDKIKDVGGEAAALLDKRGGGAKPLGKS
jgi:integrase/recombinase XerC